MKALLNFLFGLRGAFLAAGRDLMGNKAARTVMIGGVIFYSLLYPLPFHNEVPQKLPLFVVDQARSDLSRQLMRMIDSTEGVRVAAVTDSPQLALERMKGGDATAVLIIPGDFSRNIMRSGKTILPLYCDAAWPSPACASRRKISARACVWNAIRKRGCRSFPPFPSRCAGRHPSSPCTIPRATIF